VSRNKLISSQGICMQTSQKTQPLLPGTHEAGNAVSTKQGSCDARHDAKTLFSEALSAFSGFHARPRPGANERTTQTVHEVRQEVSEAGNAVSTKQGSRK
jgi:hypothetical protein